MLTARPWVPELPHDPQHQTSLSLGQARKLARCLPNRIISQGLHELPVEHRLAWVQQVGRLHAENTRQRRYLDHGGIANRRGPDPLDVLLAKNVADTTRATPLCLGSLRQSARAAILSTGAG
jgi:hypothetical protein